VHVTNTYGVLSSKTEICIMKLNTVVFALIRLSWTRLGDVVASDVD